MFTSGPRGVLATGHLFVSFSLRETVLLPSSIFRLIPFSITVLLFHSVLLTAIIIAWFPLGAE
jgi:hypothetical protein